MESAVKRYLEPSPMSGETTETFETELMPEFNSVSSVSFIGHVEESLNDILDRNQKAMEEVIVNSDL